jgi:hypothetical protein
MEGAAMIKITKLTWHNVQALRELLTEQEREHVTVGQTVATFDMSLAETQQLITTLQRRAAELRGTGRHPYQSLLAVARKVNAAAEAAR